MTTEPLIPLAHAELLYVTLSVVVQELEKIQYRGTDSLHLVLHQYCSARDTHLTEKGVMDQEIAAVTAGVIDGLNQWLDERADQNSESLEHLELWEREFINQKDEN